MTNSTGATVSQDRPRLFCYSLSFFFNSGLRENLHAQGWYPKFGLPLHKSDIVGVWGATTTARRGHFIARIFGRKVVTFEDGFIRSVRTGRDKDTSISLVWDRVGPYFDPNLDTDLQALIRKSTDSDEVEIQHSNDGLASFTVSKLSKYNNFDEIPEKLPEKFVLVVDQTKNDAAVVRAGADANSFAQMLQAARTENPDATILIKSHPETTAGHRMGYFSDQDCDGNTQISTAPIAPADLFARATKVYCVTSQMGLEAIFHGHRPVLFGQAFYAGLGLSDDRIPVEGRPQITAAQLFWATHLQYTKWRDPYLNQRSTFGDAAKFMQSQIRQFNENRQQTICLGISVWKRGFFNKYLSGAGGALQFSQVEHQAVVAAKMTGARVLVWASKETASLSDAANRANVPLVRIEDGFLRSVGLGAELIAPASLALDDLGIYYDPTRPSRLETIINTSNSLKPSDIERAKAVQSRVLKLGMTKYNLKRQTIEIAANPTQEIILVPGQVEDDASILKGAGSVKTNLDLLAQTRRDFPKAYIIYKPHPDVEAGLRSGVAPTDHVTKYADLIAHQASMSDLLNRVDRVATMTSLAGFEALMRGKNVTCYGQPFYAGWGLTDDKAQQIKRRTAKPSLAALIHATLIEYPRYWDPITQIPCPIETVLDRFERGEMQVKSGFWIRLLAKLQGRFAGYAHLWR